MSVQAAVGRHLLLVLGERGAKPGAHVHLALLVVLDERVLEELGVLGPLCEVLDETLVDERLEVLGELGALESRRIARQYSGHHLELGLAMLVRILALGELDKRDAQAPHIGAYVVHGVVRIDGIDALGRHVARAAGVVATQRVRVDQVAADAEVAEFDVAVDVDEDVRGLDVTMDQAVVLFQVVERF